MHVRKSIKLLLALFSLVCCISLIQETYAKYVTSATADTSVAISRWNIKINDQDVQENSDFSSTIRPTFDGDTYTKEGIIAPGAEGYFDIKIDGSETDVAYTMALSLSVPDESAVKDLEVTGYSIGDDPTVIPYTSDLAITFGINDDKVKTYRFFVKWVDQTETETMDNQKDTTAAYNGNSAIMKVNINVTQIAS